MGGGQNLLSATLTVSCPAVKYSSGLCYFNFPNVLCKEEVAGLNIWLLEPAIYWVTDAANFASSNKNVLFVNSPPSPFPWYLKAYFEDRNFQGRLRSNV